MDKREETPEKEIDNFLSLPTLQQEQDTLEWWRNNGNYYPTLAKLAKEYLCIPATSVPAKRFFFLLLG